MRVAGADTRVKAGPFGGLCVRQGLIVAACVETEDHWTGRSSGTNRHARLSVQESAQWDVLLIRPFRGREILTVTGCSLVRGSTCRSAVFTASNCCSLRVYLVSASFHSWDQNARGTHPSCCFCCDSQLIPSGVTKTCNSHGSPPYPRLCVRF